VAVFVNHVAKKEGTKLLSFERIECLDLPLISKHPNSA